MVAYPLFFVAALAQQSPQLADILSRLAEEAEVFEHLAPQTFSEETLRQRARKALPRFRPRIGSAALKPVPVRYQSREILSEYGYATFKDSPHVMHEFRQVISVDGRARQAQEKARRSLSLGIRSEDDNVKKRMLVEFEKHGLIGAVADFGQLILLFTNPRLPEYQFTLLSSNRVGADEVYVLGYRQISGAQSLTVFEGRKAIHQQLTGEVWVRKRDMAPLRITLRTERTEDKHVIREEATVEYVMSPHGTVLPVSVVHRRYLDAELMAENLFSYTPFRRFGAQSEVKFTEVPEDVRK